MEYSGVKLHNSITVGKIFSIHYFEYMNNFKFSGEAHNFWELVYIDKGEAGITHNKSYTVLQARLHPILLLYLLSAMTRQ